MAKNESKREVVLSALSKVKMHDAGQKVKKNSDYCSPMKMPSVRYPSMYLNIEQAPDLKGKEVGDEVTLLIKAKINSHSLNEDDRGSKENFELDVKKIGLVNK